MGDATRAILYRRVSTDEQALGLAAQLDALEAAAALRGWNAEVVTDEGVSGSVPATQRPALGPVLSRMGKGDVLVVAKLDRLSRSMLDFAGLLKRSDKEGWSIVVLDIGVDATTPPGKLVVHVLMAVAEWEREMIALRIREGMAKSEKRQGRRPGLPPVKGARPVELPDTVLAAMKDLHDSGRSPRAIADRLNAYGYPSARGKRWHRGSVRRLLERLEV